MTNSMHHIRNSMHLLGAIVLATMAACGGGGDNTTPPTVSSGSAEGQWAGSTDSNQTITTIVRDDGAYLVFYSAVGNPHQMAGLIQGTGMSTNGMFDSANARDFNLDGHGILDGVIAGHYVARQSLNGQITYTTAAVSTFTSAFDPASDTLLTLTDLAGTYVGQSASVGVGLAATGQSATVTVWPSGAIDGTDASGCGFQGTIQAHGNTFDLSLGFGAPPCVFPGSTLTGIVLLDMTTHHVLAGALLGSRNGAVMFSGTK